MPQTLDFEPEERAASCLAAAERLRASPTSENVALARTALAALTPALNDCMPDCCWETGEVARYAIACLADAVLEDVDRPNVAHPSWLRAALLSGSPEWRFHTPISDEAVKEAMRGLIPWALGPS
jgi:hypothetical protein